MDSLNHIMTASPKMDDDGLSREDIENQRGVLKRATAHRYFATDLKIDALCDLALSALESRSEVLEEDGGDWQCRDFDDELEEIMKGIEKTIAEHESHARGFAEGLEEAAKVVENCPASLGALERKYRELAAAIRSAQSTLHEQGRRFHRQGRSHAEIDAAVIAIDAALAKREGEG